jgi:KGK domain
MRHINHEHHWIVDGEDFVRGENLSPILKDEHAICLFQDFQQKSREAFVRHVGGYLPRLHTKEGLSCEVLELDCKKWVSGKLRYVLIFEPDDPDTLSEKSEATENEVLLNTSLADNSLDEIRQLGEI